jgi:sulfopyruvate decarboxylase subunit beta
MKRVEAIDCIDKGVGDALMICNLGYPARELYAVRDRPENFYMLGSMGLASSIGLGVALANPNRKVFVLDGDGSILMNMGSLSTIARCEPKNLLLFVLDNGVYGSTGSQPTPFSPHSSLARIASAAGFSHVREVMDRDGLARTLKDMDHGVVVVKVDAGNAEVPIIGLQPGEIKERFMRSASRPGRQSGTSR